MKLTTKQYKTKVAVLKRKRTLVLQKYDKELTSFKRQLDSLRALHKHDSKGRYWLNRGGYSKKIGWCSVCGALTKIRK